MANLMLQGGKTGSAPRHTFPQRTFLSPGTSLGRPHRKPHRAHSSPMLVLAGVWSSSLLLQPLAPSRPARSFARTPPLVTASILERTRSGTLTEVQPGERYCADDQPAKYYTGPNPANKAALQKMKKDIGKRKLVVITGASSGLGLFCFEALLANQVVCVDRHTSVGRAAEVHGDARGMCSSSCLV